MGDKVYERVPFRFIACPDCKFQMCWVNPRLPNYCPECGINIMARIKERIVMSDHEAILMTHSQPLAGGEYVEKPDGFPA